MNLLDCIDSELRLWWDGKPLRSPGLALFNEGKYHFGEIAWNRARLYPREINNRYWSNLSTQPLNPSLGPARHTADLVYSHLKTLIGQYSAEDQLIIAIPGTMGSKQLSLLVGILKTLPIRTGGVVHRSALIGASVGKSCLHVELQLHQTVVTKVTVQNGIAEALESFSLPGRGLISLLAQISELLGHQFLEQTRFDPQRRAQSEQDLYDQIPKMLLAIHNQGEYSLTIEGHTAQTTNECLQPIGKKLLSDLNQILPVGISHIALDENLSLLPGLEFSHPLNIVEPHDIYLNVRPELVDNNDELTFQTSVPVKALKKAVRNELPSKTLPSKNQEQSITHFLIESVARRIETVGITINDLTISAEGSLSVKEGRVVSLNGRSVMGTTKIRVGDHLEVDDLEIQFIHVMH